MRVSLKFIICIGTFIFFFSSCDLLGLKNKKKAIPGKLVFAAKDENGDSQIFTMKANGGDVKQLTHFPPNGEAYSPSWSPDGKEIIFTSFKGGISTGPAIWVMDADGSNQRFLYHPEPDNEHAVPVIGHNPKWSPDGTKVAFDLCLNCQIYTDNTIWVFDTLTKELTQLTPHEENPGYPASDLYPTWSPDGSQIAFSSNRDYVNSDTLRYRTDIFVINLDGTGLQRITNTGQSTLPKWSYNIDFIAFEWNIHGNQVYLHSISLGNTKKVNIGMEFSENPLWENNGNRLLIFGREDEQSNPEMRLIDIKNGTHEIIQSVILHEKAIGTEYDWYVPENN